MKKNVYKVLIFSDGNLDHMNEIKEELEKLKIKGTFQMKIIKGYKKISVEKMIELLIEINNADVCVICYGFGFNYLPDFSFVSGSVSTLKKRWINSPNANFCIKSDI